MLIPKEEMDSTGCLTGTDNGTSKCTTCGAEQPPVHKMEEVEQTLKDNDTNGEDGW